MKPIEEKIKILFSRIQNRADASMLLSSCVYGLCFYLISIAYSVFHVHRLAVVVGWCAMAIIIALVGKYRSRIAAILVSLYAVFSFSWTIGISDLYTGIPYADAYLTFLMKAVQFGIIAQNLILLWCSIRAVEATFRLNGRLALTRDGQ